MTGIDQQLMTAVRIAKEIHGNPPTTIAKGISYTIDPITLKRIYK